MQIDEPPHHSCRYYKKDMLHNHTQHVNYTYIYIFDGNGIMKAKCETTSDNNIEEQKTLMIVD